MTDVIRPPIDLFPIGRPSRTREDYEERAGKLGLTYLGTSPDGNLKSPHSVHNKSYWKCNRCGAIMYKTYRAVDRAVKDGYCGCVCHKLSNSDEKYKFAGEVFGWTLVGNPPRGNKDLANWLDFYGNPIQASFVEITNNPRGVPRKKFLGHTKPEIFVNGIAPGPNYWEEWYGKSFE